MSDILVLVYDSVHSEIATVPVGDYAAFDIVVVAASAGGIPALVTFLAEFPAYFPIPLVVVQHLPPLERFRSLLDRVLARRTELLVKWAEDGECLMASTVYLAPQDRTTCIEGGRLRVENRDPGSGMKSSSPANLLFRSAATEYGKRTLGIVFSGVLSDGADGCAAISQAGGQVLVQSAGDAWFRDMPEAAMLQSPTGLAFQASALAHVVCSLVMAPGASTWFAVSPTNYCPAHFVFD